ncbi:hypothetical protein Tco_0505942 [Tanacetum coccineum]
MQEKILMSSNGRDVWELVPSQRQSYGDYFEVDLLSETAKWDGILKNKSSDCSPVVIRQEEAKSILRLGPNTKRTLNADKKVLSVSKRNTYIGMPTMVSKDSITSFALTAFADADHTGCQDTRRSW